jgi:15-cis-phytoene desaturase
VVDFIDAENHSAAYQTLLGKGLTRSLVAVHAQEASARATGRTLAQLLYGLLTPSGFDRLLNGPTSDVWLTPWVTYLKQRGVDFHSGTTIQAMHANEAGITSVTAETNGQPREFTADYYISALPVEVMTPLVNDAIKSLAPSLANLDKLRTAWMNGIQFYLAKDAPLEFGHSLYGILSVDISDWGTPGIVYGKAAMECSTEEIEQEVWAQIKQHVNVDGAEVLRDDNLLRWFLDPDVMIPNPLGVTMNLEPLMINTSGSLQFRPEAFTEIPNLFLASDYVKTNTDVACMEAANEAARRAVNALLDREGSSAARASVWPLKVPEVLQPFIDYDELRFQLGLGHAGSERTWWGKAIGRLYGVLT